MDKAEKAERIRLQAEDLQRATIEDFKILTKE